MMNNNKIILSRNKVVRHFSKIKTFNIADNIADKQSNSIMKEWKILVVEH